MTNATCLAVFVLLVRFANTNTVRFVLLALRTAFQA